MYDINNNKTIRSISTNESIADCTFDKYPGSIINYNNKFIYFDGPKDNFGRSQIALMRTVINNGKVETDPNYWVNDYTISNFQD